MLKKGTTGAIFITSLVWRGPRLGIEAGTSRTRSQHCTTRLSRRRCLIMKLVILLQMQRLKNLVHQSPLEVKASNNQSQMKALNPLADVWNLITTALQIWKTWLILHKINLHCGGILPGLIYHTTNWQKLDQ